MHLGVSEFVRWVEESARTHSVPLPAPATTADLHYVEQLIGAPLPADFRYVLSRFNGGRIPSGVLLSAGPPTTKDSIAYALQSLTAHGSKNGLDLLLPFHRSDEGGVLAFDRGGGPVSDTWPIVDYYEDTGDVRLVYRTFDGWCRACASEWTSSDFGQAFSLERYLRQGERHVAVEPDVATAHATVAHALKRAGKPEEALHSYLRAARCIPALAWCDWEALKLAALLSRREVALECAMRLCLKAPISHWAQRETTPTRVVGVISRIAWKAKDRAPWVRLLSQLAVQITDAEERAYVDAVRSALISGHAPPPTRSSRPIGVPATPDNMDEWFSNLSDAYAGGRLRDEELLLDASLEPLRHRRDLAQLLRIRREF